jgi:hypothetical protein
MAQVWKAEMSNINDKFVLLALADYADEDDKCFPSSKTLATKCCLHKRTVQKAIVRLEEAGYITKEERVRKDGSCSSNHYVVSLSRLGDGPQPPCSAPEPTAFLNQSVNQPEEPTKKIIETSPFDVFWADYPKKKGKGAARAAYARALKKTTSVTIMSGLLKSDIQTAKDIQFVPHPATWLNQECWDDEDTKETLKPYWGKK